MIHIFINSISCKEEFPEQCKESINAHIYRKALILAVVLIVARP